MTSRLVAMALVAGALLPASAAAAPSGPVTDRCEPAGTQAVTTLCYGADVIARDAQAYAQPGRFEPAIQEFERSWKRRALDLQFALADDVGFDNAPWPGTHNSFNSIAQQGPALSTTDANQQLTLVDQLRLGMRSLELDVHWFPSVRAGGASAPVVCHAGAASDHDGCSTEPLLGEVLPPIAHWLDDNDDQVLLLYVEHHLDGREGYDSAAAAIADTLGDRVFETGSAGGCVEIPGTLTRDEVLAAGAQVVIVGNCGSGSAWNKLGFKWDDHEEGSAHGFQDFPACGPDHTRATYDAKLIRYYEDSTWLTAGADTATMAEPGDSLDATVVGRMMRCGVDLLGFDQLVPDDRLDALIWSWAAKQPAQGDCAAMGEDGRWFSSSCKRKRRAACRAGDGAWLVTKAAVRAKAADGACADRDATFAVPRSGYENESLKLVTRGTPVWLGYTRSGGNWEPSDSRAG